MKDDQTDMDMMMKKKQGETAEQANGARRAAGRPGRGDAGDAPPDRGALAAAKAASQKPKPDFFLILAVLILSLFGVFMVFSASYYSTIATMENPYYYLKEASWWTLIGIALMLALMCAPHKAFLKSRWLSPVFMIAAIALLIALHIPGVGETENNATRWIKVGEATIMPGEFAKIATIFFVAWYFTRFKAFAATFTRAYLPMLALTVLCFTLIYLQPNMSTAIIVCGIMAILTCIAGNPLKYLLLTGLIGFCGVFALIKLNPDGEHFSRFDGYLDPFADSSGAFYQTVQALLAFGAGGVTGVGPGQSIQKALYLPYAQNDYIFAIIGEEFGFIGCVAVICAFLFLIWRCALIAVSAPNRFSMIFASGVTIWISMQVAMNIAVVTNILPPTGVILPFISYGGNATLITLIAMGVMLNISWETARIHAAGVAVEPEEDESGGTLGVAADARPQLRPTAPTLWNETRDTERNFYGENHYGGRGYRRSSVSSPRYRG